MRTPVTAIILVLALSACGRAGQTTNPQPAAKAAAAQAPQPSADSVSPAFDQCMNSGDAARGVESAMEDCGRAELARQDAALNAAYGRVVALLAEQHRERAAEEAGQGYSPTSAERTENVRTAQRDWLKYRDSKCASENQSGGSVDRMGDVLCLAREEARRTTELEQLKAVLAES